MVYTLGRLLPPRMYQAHVCTTQNIGSIKNAPDEIGDAKAKARKKKHKRTNDSKESNTHTHTFDEEKNAPNRIHFSLSSIHVSSQNYLLLVLCFYSLFHRHTLPMSWKSISWKGLPKFIEFQGDTKTAHWLLWVCLSPNFVCAFYTT